MARRTAPIDGLLVFLLALLSVGTVAGVRDAMDNPQSPARAGAARPHLLSAPPIGLLAGGEILRVLLVGADDREDRGRADCVMVGYFSTRTHRAVLLSIPRDTKVDIPGHRRDKINHAYRFGGVKLLRRTVEGVLQHPLEHHAKLDFETFVEVVDLLGPVEVEVEDVERRGRGMNYDDNAGKLHIHLKPGGQELTGEQAIGFVRYRRDSDLKRAARQQQFVKAAIKQHVRPGNLPALLNAASHILRKMDTSITAGQAASLLPAMAGMSPDDILTLTVPVASAPSHGVYYSRIEDGAIETIMAKVDGFLAAEGSLPRAKPLKECTVAVLNGSGRAGVARSVAATIEQQGAKVTATGNAEAFDHSRTEIRYRPAGRDAAEELRDVLEVPRAGLIQDSELDAPGAATILVTVGRDYKTD